jgi:hypothetical protein
MTGVICAAVGTLFVAHSLWLAGAFAPRAIAVKFEVPRAFSGYVQMRGSLPKQRVREYTVAIQSSGEEILVPRNIVDGVFTFSAADSDGHALRVVYDRSEIDDQETVVFFPGAVDSDAREFVFVGTKASIEQFEREADDRSRSQRGHMSRPRG